MTSVAVPQTDLSRFAASNSSVNVDKVVQSVTNATKRLSQISTSTNNSNKKRRSQNRIGPWKLGRTLGRGSTGRVRLAKNINTGKLAAIKIVPKSNFKKLENPKYKNMSKDRLPYGIEREIIIMKLITHPNIMGLYDVWENKNDLYLILEYVEGGELFDYLIKRGKLQEFEAVNYFKQIINGIGYLHQFNICHRDLKPENLLLDFNKNIKIADFGMAALEVKERLLETSCGSPHYASPEIVAGKNYHGAPSDIWSCGVILFALLTGHLPFDDENIRKLLLKVQNGKYVMPHNLSPEARDLISKMLRVAPEDRITIDEILQHPLVTKYPDTMHQDNSGVIDFKNLNIKPIESFNKIDKEILKNLSILFHNCPEEAIISKLLSKRNYPEKMFYYLLMKYRNEHIENNLDYTDDDIDMMASLNTSNMNRSSSSLANSKKALKKTTSKKALANITNTTSSFTASTSFNKKKNMVINNHVISRTSSSKSIKVSKSPTRTNSKITRKLTGIELNNLGLTPTQQVSITSAQRANSPDDPKLSKMEQYERNLANQVQQKNDAMASKMKQEEKSLKRQEEAKRQQILAQEKERLEAMEDDRQVKEASLTSQEKLSRQTREVTHNALGSNRRFVTDPIKQTQSSLDPRIAGINSLLRAKSFTSPASYASLRRSGMNENTTKVLQKLGIELNTPISQVSANRRFSGNIKTSSSTRLSDYIKTNANDLEEDKENMSLDDFNKEERNKSLVTPTVSKKNLPNLGYKSLLSNIVEDKSSFDTRASFSSNQFKTSESKRSGLIPNPRFSRFSFNGLLSQFDEAADVSIYNSTLQSSGTVIKREVTKRSSIVSVDQTPTTRIVSHEVTDNNFVSVEITEGDEDNDNSTLVANAISDQVTFDASESSLYPDKEVGRSRNDFDTDLSHMDIISSRVADVGKVNKTRPSLINENSSGSDHKEGLTGFYQAKSLEKTRYSYNGSPESNYDMLDSSTVSDTTDDPSRRHTRYEDDDAEERSNYAGGAKKKEHPQEKDQAKRDHSSASTEIFSTMAMPRYTKDTEDTIDISKPQESLSVPQQVHETERADKVPERTAETAAPLPQVQLPSPTINSSQIKSPKLTTSMFKRLSLKPKREAPQPPTPTTAVGDEPRENWFMKFIHSLSSSTQSKQPRKNLHTINSNLMSSDLMRIVKNTLQLKKIEGTLSDVNIDEEFGLIDGSIPSKFAYGRRLKFRIEVIDLVSASSLHILKVKGSDKGFDNLVQIVEFIVKREEEANNHRKSALSFSGYQQRS